MYFILALPPQDIIEEGQYGQYGTLKNRTIDVYLAIPQMAPLNFLPSEFVIDIYDKYKIGKN